MSTHGVQLSPRDKKVMCRRMAEEDLKIKIAEKQLADILGTFQRTVHDWISDIRARQHGTRNNLVYKLNMLGWTQKEIAEKVSLDQSTVTKIMKKADFGKIHNEFETHYS